MISICGLIGHNEWIRVSSSALHPSMSFIATPLHRNATSGLLASGHFSVSANTLSTKGIRFLQSLGFDSFSRFRPKEFAEMSFPHLEHTLALNDFLIAARLLPRSCPEIPLAETRHDLDLKKTPLKVPGAKTHERVSLVPDGFLDFRLTISGKSYAMPIWVELDRGSEWGKQVKQKMRGILTAIATHAYEDMFSVINITVAFATTKGIKRRDLLRSCISQELDHMGIHHLSNVFLFASIQQDIDPDTLFLSPLGLAPQYNTPLPLLDLSEE